MAKINLFNVVKMLYEEFKTKVHETPINVHEIIKVSTGLNYWWMRIFKCIVHRCLYKFGCQWNNWMMADNFDMIVIATIHKQKKKHHRVPHPMQVLQKRFEKNYLLKIKRKLLRENGKKGPLHWRTVSTRYRTVSVSSER